MFEDPASEGYARAMNAMLKMKKRDIAELEHAYQARGILDGSVTAGTIGLSLLAPTICQLYVN